MKATAAAGLNGEALKRLSDALARLINTGRLPGAVWMVHRHGALGCFESLGALDPVRGLPMRADAIDANERREAILANAPDREGQYFGVPKVVE